jgi:tetratricopeptide (TPR) repeat protein
MVDLVTIEESDEFARIVKLGDEARDARNWGLAAHYYKAAVSLMPEAATIHVQLGHSLKEAGDFGGAEAAYLRALDLAPDDVDLHLQLGHFYKLRGDISAALRYYRSARSRGSRDPHMLSYLATPGVAAPSGRVAKDFAPHPETGTPAESGYPVFDFQLTSISRPRKEGEAVVFSASVELDRITKDEFQYLAQNRNLRFGCQVYSDSSDSDVIASERGAVREDNTSPTSLIITFSLQAELFIDRKWRLVSMNCVYDGKFWFSDRGRPSTYAGIVVDTPDRPDLFQYYLENFNSNGQT